MYVTSATKTGWLESSLEALKGDGIFVIEGVLDKEFIDNTKKAMYLVQERIHSTLGLTKLERAKELGVLRLMMKFDPWFLKFLEIPKVLEVIDATVSSTATLHLQNGFILPSFKKNDQKEVFQNSFHRDFKRILNGYLCSINIMFSIDSFERDNGATLYVPGSQQREPAPDLTSSKRDCVPALCSAGSMVVFDSTLWHAAGINTSGADRLAINHQFTRSYLKQQIDYSKALDIEKMKISEKTKQLLGWYTRVPTSLEEYYVEPENRFYRAEQG